MSAIAGQPVSIDTDVAFDLANYQNFAATDVVVIFFFFARVKRTNAFHANRSGAARKGHYQSAAVTRCQRVPQGPLASDGAILDCAYRISPSRVRRTVSECECEYECGW